jgi:hypothetical protein
LKEKKVNDEFTFAFQETKLYTATKIASSHSQKRKALASRE